MRVHKALFEITRTLKAIYFGNLDFFHQTKWFTMGTNRHCWTPPERTSVRICPFWSGCQADFYGENVHERLFAKFSSTWPHSRKFWETRNLLLAFNRQSNHPPTTRINFIKMLTRRPKYSTRKPCRRPSERPSIDWSQRQFMNLSQIMNLSQEFSARTFFMTDARRSQH